MTNRERIIETLSFRQADKLPYSIALTQEMEEKILADTGGAGQWKRVNNHTTGISLCKPQNKVCGKSGYYADEFGVIWNKNGADKDIGVIEGRLISSPDDLLKYEFPQIDEGFLRSQCEALEGMRGENFTLADIGFSLFERAWTLCSMEDLLCYMITEPEFVHELMERITRYNLKKIDISLEYDMDCNMFGDDWGQQRGLIMGPEHWREFVAPYLRRMYGRAKSAGRYVCQHSCGDIGDIMDDAIDAGLDIYQTFQPEIYDIRRYKEILDGRLTIWGGISTQADLPYKTPDEIERITKETIEVLWRNGGYIAAPTHAVPPDVPVENLLAMLEAFEGARGV